MTARNAPAFLGNLQEQDFKAIAADGNFVYCYLRSKDGFAAAGTPYYVGIGKRACRPFEPHTCSKPRSKSHVRVLRSSVTREEAIGWEKFYIQKFGRMDIRTGILRNQTDGGDGNVNYSPEVRAKISLGQLTDHSHETMDYFGLTLDKYMALTNPERAALRSKYQRFLDQKQYKADLEHSAKYGLSVEEWRSKSRAEKVRALGRYKLGYRNREILWADRLYNSHRPERSAAYAKKYEICPVLWDCFSSVEKARVYTRFQAGIRDVAELIDEQDFSGKSKKMQAHNENQQITAAKEARLDLNIYRKLARKDRSAMYQWLKRNPEKTGNDYAVKRGWI
jgi:hypothetical protein